jgi:hypothetical protein
MLEYLATQNAFTGRGRCHHFRVARMIAQSLSDAIAEKRRTAISKQVELFGNRLADG